jgi:hypothetical protein
MWCVSYGSGSDSLNIEDVETEGLSKESMMMHEESMMQYTKFDGHNLMCITIVSKYNNDN